MYARRILPCALPLLLAATPALAEPTEADMRRAIEQHAEAANEENRRVQKLCEEGRYEQDPALAFQCLSQFIGSGGQGAAQSELKSFRKLACAPAQGQPGYVCDYAFSIDTNNPLLQQGYLADIMHSPGAGQGRFVPYQGEWLFLKVGQ